MSLSAQGTHRCESRREGAARGTVVSMKLARTRPDNPYDHMPVLPEFSVTSTDLRDGEHMVTTFAKAGGDNLSPQLSWHGFPPDTQSFAVACYDPDAPNVAGWWHWLVVDLPLSCTSLPRGAGAPDSIALPAGARQFRNDSGTIGYSGAAPPAGDHDHRYIFTVFALDAEDIGVPADASAAVCAFMLNAHALARGHLTALFRVE